MPQPFNNAVMTNGGAGLLTRAQAGEIKIEFTRIAIGSGTYTEDEKELSALQAMENLKELRNSYAFSDINAFSDHSVKLTALITNQDPETKEILVDEGYYINEMGIYAKPSGGDGGTEVLYSIAVTTGENGDFMPPYNGYNPAQIIQDYYATVSNSANVTIVSNYLMPSSLFDAKIIIAAFKKVYGLDGGGSGADPTAMTPAQVMAALATEWDGEASPDPSAMTPGQVAEALATEWDGGTSPDPSAMTAEQVAGAIK